MERAIDRFNLALVVAGGIAIALMMLHISADVLARLLASRPIDGTLETIENYYMVMVVFLPLGYVARDEGHIFVELFTKGLSERRLAWLEVAVGVVTLCFMLLLTWNTLDEAITKTALGEFREMGDHAFIVWPSRWFPPLGFGAMTVAVLLRLGADLRRARG